MNESQPFFVYKDQRVLMSLLPRPVATTVLLFPVFVSVDVQLRVGQVSESEEKQ